MLRRPDGVEDRAPLLDRIRVALRAVGAKGTDWHRDGVTVSASVGLATFPDDGATADEMLLTADRACFVAKRGGRDRIATAAEGLGIAAEFSLQGVMLGWTDGITQMSVGDKYRFWIPEELAYKGAPGRPQGGQEVFSVADHLDSPGLL